MMRSPWKMPCHMDTTNSRQLLLKSTQKVQIDMIDFTYGKPELTAKQKGLNFQVADATISLSKSV